ncbi:beta-methylarginine biosynthesis bifunctional aminotransferase [Pseudomonas congelans]|uniref:beta-methylarginine biosynthesis bifunctional aminotransferase n=1 Tax=Pseudomonas congelans TaxID=200452 RepID=UPI000BB67232|nr:beta-methylarginine biosynthesis bifunctional aminotransferase [Pseudomonas congelans]PBP96766.1 beta-methylarginine biosynthesis bifunctional aminotransferase [Pseudomonas congelans]QVX14011.1 beta-methylarginine biosynthesis bifunctional aminotransferase [Pseudomonas congelans]
MTLAYNKRHQIVRPDSCLSVLQQRLKYARSELQESACYFVENVPVWPGAAAPTPFAASTDIFQYADCNGAPPLINTICARDNALYGLDLSGENFLVTNGGMHGLSLVFRQIKRRSAEPGSAVCLAPVFGAVPALLEATGYDLIYYQMSAAFPTVEEILAVCRVDTRLVYLNFPHNPLGGIYSDAFIEQLVPSLAERGISLVLDMVYDSFIFDDQKIRSPFACTSDLSLLYTVNSVSKNYGSPGLRIGWVASSSDNVEAMAGMLEIECVAVCSPAQTKAASLISMGNAPLHQQVVNSRAIVREFLGRHLSRYASLPPAGTQVFVNLPVHDIEGFADQMLGEYGLVLATASNYSGAQGAHIRIPTGYPESITHNALELLRQGIERYADV